MNFEMTEVPKNTVATTNQGTVQTNNQQGNNSSGMSQENIGKMLSIAGDIVKIAQSKEEHQFQLDKMDKCIKAMEQQTDDYVRMLKANTNGTVNIMEQVRKQLKDFYEAPHPGLEGKDYVEALRVITEAALRSAEKIEKLAPQKVEIINNVNDGI